MRTRVGRLALTAASIAVTFALAPPSNASAVDCGVDPEPIASVQTLQPTDIKLGRGSGGTVERQIALTWAGSCTIPEGVTVTLEPGALSGDDTSLSTTTIKPGSATVIGGTMYLVLSLDRTDVEPGKYSGVLLLRVTKGDVEYGQGAIPLTVYRQEALFGPHFLWNPVTILVMAAIGGLVFGWWRSLAISDQETSIRFFNKADKSKVTTQRLLAGRNLVAVGFGLGAGVTAWNAGYLSKPDFQLDAEAVLALLGVVGAAVATAVLTFLKPSQTMKDSAITSIIAGAPASLEPDGVVAPANLAALAQLGALGNSAAWSTGEHVVLLDGSHAHWNGTAWADGDAP
jgi:hypothetical protein